MADFDDPFKPPPDATIMRPRPGAGRRSTGEAPPVARAPQPAALPPRVEPVSDAAREFLGKGLNPLVQAASPLLLLAGQLRGTLAGPEVGAFRRHVLEEIRRFEERARAERIPNEVVLAARYALCAALDESVLSTPWGAQSEWAQQTLLVALHREAWGGEKFFEMLDRIGRDPGRHLDLMELQYLIIAFGFAGKYQVSDRGHAKLAEVQQDLYRRIREQRGIAPTDLSLRWEGVKDKRSRLIRYVPWWVVGAAALAVLTVAFLIYNTLLSRTAEPVKTALSNLRDEAFKADVPDAPVGPRLRSYLTKEEASGEVRIAEDGAITTVTLPASDLFQSGVDTVNQRYRDLLERIAAALDRVPGRIQIVGHTDSTRPGRSARFADNFELSRARARSVAGILAPRMANPARLEVNGKGDTQQIDRTNPARNRRVEIVHISGS